jgi:hypothetical protein
MEFVGRGRRYEQKASPLHLGGWRRTQVLFRLVSERHRHPDYKGLFHNQLGCFLNEHIIPRELLQPKAAETDPPKLAEFLLIAFATSRQADHMIGDRNEKFDRECEEFGRDRAVRRYWADTLRSLRPLLVRAIGRALKWGVVVAAVKRFF